MRISIPYFLRSPKYRATIKRRMGETSTITRRGSHVFVEGPRLLRSRRARWWLHPLFFAGLASIIVGGVLALLERAV